MPEKDLLLGIFELSNKVDRNFEKFQSQLKEHKRELDSHKKIQTILITIILGTTIAFLAVFVLLAIDYFKFTSESRQHLYDKLEQKDKEFNILNSCVEILENKLQHPDDTIR